MKILVTGGAGFIGSHVADAYRTQGHEVHILDDLSGGFRHNVHPDTPLHEHDIRSEAAARLFETHRFEVLVHLAAQMDVRHSVADPRFDADVNVLGTLNLLEAGRKNELRRVIFASTGGAIYGEPEYTPQDEVHPARPLSPYGITKLTTEKYLYFYEQQYGLPYVVLRYGNIYGPRQNPHGEAGVVAIFTERMLQGQGCFINGDGLQTRDYTYVDDVVAANLAALGYEGSGIFNVGTGVETSVVDLFRIIRAAIDPSLPEQYRAGKPGEQRRSVLGYEHAETELGWTPSVNIEEGLERTVDWFRTRSETASA
ncbi:MAG: NAD-dependent epimerase/dehydratase family protein [Bacteroidota bacterium]